jgi:hypothetical protein
LETLLTPDRYYRQQQQIAAATVAGAGKLWRRVTDDFRSFEDVRRPMLELVQTGRLAAATSSVEYTPRVLAETNQVAVPAGFIAPAAFVRSAPDGRDMGSLLDETVVKARVSVAGGATSVAARESAGVWLTGMLLTVMADTGRSVVGADIAQRPTLTGYVRMLNPPSCERCVILAGKWFRWNDGFLRHPRCDCRHIPASENIAGDLTTDPYAYFNSLSADAQTKTFGRIEARAIRDGGDIFRVVNLKNRGLATAKGNLRFGTPSRITIDDIYRTAGTRTNAIRMMQQEGFITGPQVAGGNILGVREGFGQLGKGGAAKAAREAVVAARVGVRDPLNRYTMTAGERRLYDAQYRLNEARQTGMLPRSIGANSADKYTRGTPLTPGDLATLEKAYANEVARLRGDPSKGIRPAPSSVQNLARLLGIF